MPPVLYQRNGKRLEGMDDRRACCGTLRNRCKVRNRSDQRRDHGDGEFAANFGDGPERIEEEIGQLVNAEVPEVVRNRANAGGTANNCSQSFASRLKDKKKRMNPTIKRCGQSARR